MKNNQIRVTLGFSSTVTATIEKYGKYAQIKHFFYRGRMRLAIQFSTKSKTGYYKLAGDSNSIKTILDDNVLSIFNIDPSKKYALIPISDDPGSFWLNEYLMPASYFTNGNAILMSTCINSNKKAQQRRVNIKDPDSTVHLVDSDQAYVDYCRRHQNKNFRDAYNRGPRLGMVRGHKFSIAMGQKLNIPKEAIANSANMIEQTNRENGELGINCLITEEELKKLTKIDW